LDDLGLVPALRSLAAEFAERSKIAVELTVAGALPSLSTDAELAFFRALQAALSNVARHAGARAVAVRLATEGEAVTLEIRDDGRGIPQGADPRDFERKGHMGLAGMRERIGALGGSVQLDGSQATGVRLIVRLPRPAPSPA
jgi:signal transduction histidine kinase